MGRNENAVDKTIDKVGFGECLEKLNICEREAKVTGIPEYLGRLAKEFATPRGNYSLNIIQYIGAARNRCLSLDDIAH